MPADSTPASEGFILWLEGLPGSGKTTLSRELGARLRSEGWKVEVLDGDEVRRMFSPDLGFTRKDRELHARRVSYVSRMLARNGVAVIVAMITPYETSRQAARAEVGTTRFTEVWLSCPLAICQQRDPKGIYRQTEQGLVKRMTGVDDPFEEPLNPDLVLDTSSDPATASAQKLYEHLASSGLLTPHPPRPALRAQ
ncbi:MAG: adenylyl-sulfate kinase [Thermoplasmata archaeon]|nr:adenylyl-sulfate kinase [Thermoplasmata archaeon]